MKIIQKFWMYYGFARHVMVPFIAMAKNVVANTASHIMLDLNSGSGLKLTPPDFADHVNAVIDRGILERRARDPRRTYLGASLLGDPCARKLVYIGSGAEPDEPLTARMIRIFDVGHTLEDFLGGGVQTAEADAVFVATTARWFHDAGFDLRTRNSKGRQFGWEAIDGRIQGHIDGAFVSGPAITGLKYPALWECKSANKKSWNKLKKHGIKIGNEIYWGQANLNMAYLAVDQMIFTVINKDSSELTHELLEIDPAVAQRLSDRALEIVNAISAQQLPDRIASQPDFYICKMCQFYRGCWR